MKNVNPLYLIESDLMTDLTLKALKFGTKKACKNSKKIFHYAKDKYQDHKSKKSSENK